MAVIDDLIAQIKSQGTISQWRGSVDSDTALKGMAQRLADAGVTDINQVGMITIPADEEVSPDYANGGYVDKRGNPVDPSIVTVTEMIYDWGPVTSMTAPLGKQVTLGNKATGQALGTGGYSTSEKTAPNMFGGTSAGKGGTSYNVEFDANGNPIFYAGKVARSSTGDIKSALSLAALVGGIGGLEGLIGGAGSTGGLSALDAGMNAYGTTGTIGAEGLGALDAGMNAYPSTGNIGMEGLDAGMGAYPSTGNIGMEGLDAGMGAYPSTGTVGEAATSAATAAKSALSVSDAIRLAGIAATVAGAGKLAGSLAGTAGNGAYDIVPIPADWTSPPPTSTAAFTPLPEIDFGNKEMLRGTQWERLLSPDYGKAPAPTQYAQPNNMSYDELTRILGSSRTSVPTQSLTINDVISGIQNQYGQAPKGAVG